MAQLVFCFMVLALALSWLGGIWRAKQKCSIVRCAACNYDLMGLCDEAVCPECGTSGRLHRFESVTFRFAAREWLWTVSFVLVAAAALSMARPLALVRYYAQYESWTAAWNNVFCSHPFGSGVYTNSAIMCSMSAGLVALSRRFGVRVVGVMVLVLTAMLFLIAISENPVRVGSVFGLLPPGRRFDDDPLPVPITFLMISGLVVIVSLWYGQSWNNKGLIERANRSHR